LLFECFFPVVCPEYPCFFLIFPVCAAYALLELKPVLGRAPATLNAAIMAEMKSVFMGISLVDVHPLTLSGCGIQSGQSLRNPVSSVSVCAFYVCFIAETGSNARAEPVD